MKNFFSPDSANKKRERKKKEIKKKNLKIVQLKFFRLSFFKVGQLILFSPIACFGCTESFKISVDFIVQCV